jgi:CDP-ribitol ribitolphosphotransferase
MKNLLFRIYAHIFNKAVKKGVIKNRVVLISMHNANFEDALGQLYEKLSQRGDLEIIRVSRNHPFSFFFGSPKKTARAKYIFLNDNFLPLADLDTDPETMIVQLWHGQGAFKKFGLDIDVEPGIREREAASDKKLSFAVCSSQGVRDIYSKAFGLSAEQTLPLGSADSDWYFQEHDIKEMRDRFDDSYPAANGKKLVLYAPTFRDDRADDEKLLDGFYADKVCKALGEEYCLLVRLHPQVHSTQCILHSVCDVTSWKSTNELCLMSDILITDYSSICMDFALQSKPMVFYAFDLDKYSERRGFYFDYESYVPGPVAHDLDELLKILEQKDFQTEKIEQFRKMNFGEPDGKAAARIAELVV